MNGKNTMKRQKSTTFVRNSSNLNALITKIIVKSKTIVVIGVNTEVLLHVAYII